MLRVRLTHTGAANMIARIIHLVEEAQGSKAPTARFIDRFSAYYTPAAMALAALIIVGPPFIAGADWYTWIYRGLATLLIACPCALVISTPAAIASGLASGARRGLLIKGGAALETLGRVKTIAFDKTGTLTIGKPQGLRQVGLVENRDIVLDVVWTSGDPDQAVTEAMQRGAELLVPTGSSASGAAKRRTSTIPIVFISVGSP